MRPAQGQYDPKGQGHCSSQPSSAPSASSLVNSETGLCSLGRCVGQLGLADVGAGGVEGNAEGGDQARQVLHQHMSESG